MSVDRALLIVELVIIVGVHLEVVERELFLDTLLEGLTLLKGQRVGLGDNGDNVDDIGQLLQDDNIDGLETTRLLVSDFTQVAELRRRTHA